MKIYPQTAPEIPTGESSIGWEAGEAGWATVPPHHPPRGSRAVSANSPESPGLRKQGLGPWQEGRVLERGGWSAHQPGAGPASLGRQPGRCSGGGQRAECTWAHMCMPGSACPALVPSFAHCFCLRLTRNAKQGLDAEALREEAASFRYPLRQSPAAWMGPIIALEGRGEAGAAAPVRNPGRAAPLHRALWLGPGPWKAAQRFHSFLHMEGCCGWAQALPQSPHPQLALGSHLRPPGGPRVGWEAVSAPLASRLGSKPSPKIKKYFGELKSAQGGDGLKGAGSRRSSKGALVFDKGGPLAPALVLLRVGRALLLPGFRG